MKKLSIITLLLTLSTTAVAQTSPPPGAFVTKWAIKPGGDDITIPTLENNIEIDDLDRNPPYPPAHTTYAYNYTINWGDPGSPSNEEIITNATPPSHHYENTGANERIVTITITSNNSVDGFPRMAFDYRENPQKEMALKLRSVEQWGTIRWQSMGRAFWGCQNLKVNVKAGDIPDLSEVTHMRAMFQDCPQIDFIPNVEDWNVSNVINMIDLFLGTRKFNQNINGWNVTNVKTMNQMFANADAFDQDISGWNVSNVTDMFFMFFSADNFNQDISGWDVSNVTNMNAMFQNARNFDQDLGSWDVSSVGDMTFMLQNTAMSCTNYSATLTGWATNNPSRMAMNLGTVGYVENGVETPREYGTNAADVVRILTDERGWTIDNHIETEGECLLFEIEPIGDATIDENEDYSTGLPPVTIGAPVGGISSVTYSLGGADAAVFSIDEATGVVTMEPKDFENPVDADRDNRYEVAIIATDENGNYDRNDWTVTVENVSETITFTIDDITDISIKENTGYAGPTPSLSGDMPAGVVTYTLDGADVAAFTIDVNSGVVSMEARDFETPEDADMDNVYEVLITAIDQDGNTASEDWTVTIENVIEPANFRITAIGDEQIDENTPYIGPTPIFSDDSDLPIGKVTYTLSGPDVDAFTIDENSGVVSMVARDYENPADANGNNVYEVFLTATDSDGNNDSEDWTVIINEVSMINFTIDPIADETIDENTDYSGPTPSLSGDTPVGSVTYTLDGADAAAFTIDGNTGIVFMEARDYEDPADADMDNVYEVVITATDEDNNTSTATWTVTVLDVLVELPEAEGPNIPTAFTPNGDGINDTWIIDDLASDASVVIRNRQGTILYESRNYAAQPWDGRYKGDVLPAGGYLFTIRNGTAQFRGTIVILK